MANLKESVRDLGKTVADLKKPGGTPTSNKNAADWNRPGGGYDQWKAHDSERETQHPIGSPVTKAPDTSIGKEDLAKPSSYHKGGTVQKGGWAKVLKGEKIMAAAESVMGGDKKKSAKKKSKKSDSKKGDKKKPHRMHVRGAANGGYIVEHEYKNKPGDGEPQENEEHQLSSLDDLKEHIGEHAADMGGNAEEEQEAESSAAQPQPAQAAAGM